MLSFHPSSLRNHSPIECYNKNYQDPFLHPLYPFQERRTSVPPMPIKSGSLDSVSESLVPTELSAYSIQPFDNRTPSTPPMSHKRNQSIPYPPPQSTQISSFDLEYALLEHALRKDRSSSSMPKALEEGRPQRCPSPPLLEPEFYFGDILGDEAIPPQPLVNICKDEEKIQSDEADHMEEPTNFVNYEHRPLSDDNHFTATDTDFSNETGHPETDLSTALASLVSSHVSAESIDPKSVEKSSGKALRSLETAKKTQVSSKRRASEDALERPKKFARHIQNTGWPSEQHSADQFYQLESNPKSVTETMTTHFLRGDRGSLLHPKMDENIETLGEIGPTIHSPLSDSSMTGPAIRSHPDLYENLSPYIREKVDRLRHKISSMPRRKLRESLAQGVSLEDVEPLMCLNRDELAGMLGLGVTTLKMFVHNTLGVPRWPARALKSQQVKVQKLVQKKMEAERKGDQEQVKRVQRDLTKMKQVNMRRNTLLQKDGELDMEESGTRKKDMV